MSRALPYPLLFISLVAMWLLLNGFSVGQFVLALPIALFASFTMAALQPAKPNIRRWSAIVRLIGLVAIDVLRSNLAVARLILSRTSMRSRSGFVTIPLEVRERNALAVLACVLTATPGTAWVEYRSAHSTLLLHVLDLGDEQGWIDLIKKRYEPLLLEIFE